MAGKQEMFAPTVGDSLLGACAQEGKDDNVAAAVDKESNLGCRDVSSCTLSFLGNDLPQVSIREEALPVVLKIVLLHLMPTFNIKGLLIAVYIYIYLFTLIPFLLLLLCR